MGASLACIKINPIRSFVRDIYEIRRVKKIIDRPYIE